VTAVPTVARCDRHVGDAYPSRCHDCDELAAGAATTDVAPSPRPRAGQTLGYPTHVPPAAMSDPQRAAYWRRRARRLDDGIRDAIAELVAKRPTAALATLRTTLDYQEHE